MWIRRRFENSLAAWSAATVVIAVASAGGAGQADALESVRVPPHGDQGCWVQLFAQKNLGPPNAFLNGKSFIENFHTGPVVTPSLRDVGGQAFVGQAGSMIVGPKARVVGYKGENFSEPVLTVGPLRKVLDLDALGFRERVKSLKVLCE